MPFSRMGGPDHRKWSWADEQAWIGTFRLPYGKFRKDVSWANPLLSPTVGKFDSSNVQFPCVVKKAHDGHDYWLFYTGYGGVPLAYRVGVAYGDTPWGPFTKGNGGDAIIDLQAGPPAHNHDYCCSVMYDEIDGEWKMWFIGFWAGTGKMWRAHAAAPEGAWTVDGQCAAFPANWIATQGVKRMGNMYWAPYKTNVANNPVHVMYSDDGDTWVEHAQILIKGAAGEWDQTSLDYNSSYYSAGVFYVLYGGYDGVNTHIGLATSPYGFRYGGADDFFKHPLNPVLTVGAGGTWDDSLIGHPSLQMVDDVYYLWYMGYSGVANSQKIGLAQNP